MSGQDILHVAQRLLWCPICQRQFDRRQIILRGVIRNIYFVQTNCDRDHIPVSALMAIERAPNSLASSQTNETITQDEALDLRLALDTFDGNFRRQFALSQD